MLTGELIFDALAPTPSSVNQAMLGGKLGREVPFAIPVLPSLGRVDQGVAVREQELITVILERKFQLLNLLLQRLHLSRCLEFTHLKVRVDLVDPSVDEIETHAHVVVHVEDLLLVDFHLGELILGRLLVIQLEREKLGFDRDLRELQVKLVVGQELVLLLILEELNPLEISSYKELTSFD